MAGEAREKCAVAGALSANVEVSAAEITYLALDAMQHRGEEASGIAATPYNGRFETHRQLGKVPDIYTPEAMARLAGSLAVGHNRYSTSGDKTRHFQPVVDEAIHLAFAHNGNLPTTSKLEHYLDGYHLRYERANDSEMMGYAISQLIRSGKDLPDAIEEVYPLFTGAFSCVASHADTLVAVRDPYGIRPLGLGKIDDGHMVASETCALDMVNAEYIDEVQPGEMVVISKGGIEERRQLAEPQPKLDMFEFVYFARHDSILYGQRVSAVRRRFGAQLAEEYPFVGDNYLVVPVPDSAVPVAEGYADALGLQHLQAIIKNRYRGGRSFMKTNQTERQKYLRLKHTVIPEFVKNRDVIVIDDSIVRLNTMPIIVRLLKAAGAKSIQVLVSSPPVRFPDYYGIDTPDQRELAAANLKIGQLEEVIGCRKLGYLSLGGMVKATGIAEDKFNLSCFTGEYPIDIGERKREISAPVSWEGVK